jgi:hypothetical protein
MDVALSVDVSVDVSMNTDMEPRYRCRNQQVSVDTEKRKRVFWESYRLRNRCRCIIDDAALRT